MTLEGAIKHAEEVAEENSKRAKHIRDKMASEVALSNATECETCADDHRQLAEWLTELLKRRKEEPQWIMCSERLPEEDGQYLITVKYKHVNGYEGVYAEHGDWFDGEWDMYYCSGHCGEVEDIIAWMPLPEPCNAKSEV